MGKPLKGIFKPSNPKKYIGNSNNIIYRSGWERKFMIYLDNKDTVNRWGSEEIPIKYWNPMKKKVARYFPDFYVEYIKKGGGVKKCLIEIKPLRECSPPKYTKRTRNVMIAESLFAQNTAKWRACEEFCEDNGLEFRILTEKDLFKNG